MTWMLMILYFFMCLFLGLALFGKKSAQQRTSRGRKTCLHAVHHLMAKVGKYHYKKFAPKGKVFPFPVEKMGWEAFYGYKICCALLLAVAALIISQTFVSGLLFGAGGLALGFWIPDFIMKIETNKRNRTIIADLPYILDLLYISTLSGQNIYRSMEILVQNYDGEVCRQFEKIIENIAFGRGIDAAYQDLYQKPNPDQFKDILNLLQITENCGANIAEILKQKSGQLKFEISQEIERKSRKVSLMILTPLAFLILPSFVLLVGGPLIFTIGGDFFIF